MYPLPLPILIEQVLPAPHDAVDVDKSNSIYGVVISIVVILLLLSHVIVLLIVIMVVLILLLL